MRSTFIATVGILGAVTLAGAVPDRPMENAQLGSELETALGAAGWDGDRWSVLVVSLDRGDTLYSRGAAIPRTPASNLKLFTTAAALHVLGPGYRYPTFVTAVGPIRDGVVDGDLFVYGTGDPTLSDRFLESKTAIWEALADSLAAVGIQRITGDLVGDGSYFQGSPVGAGWERSYMTHTYAAPATALAYNDNVVTMRITAGPMAGSKANIQLIPGGSVDVQVEAITTTSGRSRVIVERADYGDPVVVSGTVRKGSSAVWRAVPVVDPARFAASVFEEILAQQGIRVEGRIRSVYSEEASPITGQRVFAPATREDPPIQVLTVHRSPPLLEILEVINQRSHNLYADAVLRTVGRVATGTGTAAGGEAAVLALLEKAGHPAAALKMDDGSGLSTQDRASAEAIVGLLAFMAKSPYAEEYFQTLPEAATSRGLRRMHRTPAAGNLRAKTGTIDRVSALSGYVTASNGERLAFSILSNDVPSTWTAKRVEDRIGARLAAFDRPVVAAAQRRAAAARPTPDTAGPSTGSTRGERSARQAAEATEPAEEAAEASRTYTVKQGDTLDGIARKMGTTVAALRAANPGIEPRRLMPGQSLKIPGS